MKSSNFYDLDYSDLTNFFTTNSSLDPKKINMRANQIWKFVYKKGLNISLMKTSADLKEDLKENFNFNRIEISEKKISKDGTIKWLLKLADNNLVETVFIPSEKRGTLCISSQVGCTLNCKFCHTGTQRMVKNLTTHEIINQILVAKDELNDWGTQKKITNVVYMGMGEPLLNFDSVTPAIALMMDDNGLEYSPKKITISTAGISTEIIKAANEIGTYLALSLHAPTDELLKLCLSIKNLKLKI